MTGCLDFRVGKEIGERSWGQAAAHRQFDSSIINVTVKIARKYMKFQCIKCIGKLHGLFESEYSFRFCNLYCHKAELLEQRSSSNYFVIYIFIK